MILTAYDHRVNPAAALLKCRASHACESLVKLLRTADALEATADNYTKISKDMHGQYDTRPKYRGLTPEGDVLYVRALRYT